MCEQDTRKQLLNGICRTKSEKTPDIAPQDGVFYISGVLDSRERLEIDVKYHAEGEQPDRPECTDLRWVHVPVDTVLSWLDRQAAITRNIERGMHDFILDNLQQKCDKLTEERDELRRERNIAIGRASYMESAAAEELAKLLGENDTIEVYDDKIHGKRRLVTGTQRKLEKQIDEMQEAIDAMGNGQFYAMYLKACDERDHFKDLAQESAERICVPHGEWERLSQTQEFRRMYCDCGYELGMDTRETFPYEHTIYCPMPHFCQECGARIVSKANSVKDE